MPMKLFFRPASRRLSLVLTSLAVFVGAGALPAAAEKKARAPISYAGDGASAQAAPRVTKSTDTGRRVEFRYPDQPERFYSRDGVRSQPTAAPVKFSSSSSAVDQLMARQYASASTPKPQPQVAPTDPNLTRGAFDARAVAKQTQSAYVEPKASVDVPMPPLRDEAPAKATPVSRSTLTGATVKVVEPVTPVFDETSVAIVYEAEFEGLPTANGEVYASDGMTAAHPNLPLPSLLHVVNDANGREVVVRVNDRGPFEDGAGLQLSAKAADALGLGAGRGKVSLRYLGPAPQQTGAPPAPRVEATPQRAMPEMQRVAYAPKVTGEAYAVQLGAFATRANADALYREVMGVMPASVESANVNGVIWHRVRVGPVEGRAAADALLERLASEGFDNARIVAAN